MSNFFSVDFHAQLDGAVGNAGTDGAQADDAEGLALDLVSHELLFALLHPLCHGGVTGKTLSPLGGSSHIAVK